MSKIVDKPDILAVVRNEGIELKLKGRDWWGACPFHGEKSPSFKLNTETQRFICFGCGASGDAIDFIMKIHSLSYKEAKKHLRLSKLGTDRNLAGGSRLNDEERAFREWKHSRTRNLSDLHRLIFLSTANICSEQELEEKAWLLHELTWVRLELDLLCEGTDEERKALFKDFQKEKANDSSESSANGNACRPAANGLVAL